MARPKKNYCDYFPHDRDMRNHRKVKAIRTKFGPTGYAIWSMTLEYLTGIDGNEFEYSDVEFELMAGDFGVSAPEIRQMVDYCIKLGMLSLIDGFIHSESLDERLKPVYEKRGDLKRKSEQQHRVDGKFANINTADCGVSAPESTQTKRKETKLKETKEIPIVPLMFEVFTQKNKNYPKNNLKDFPALREIVLKIAELKKLDKNLVFTEKQKDVMDFWEKMVNFISADKFYSATQLSTISNQFQSIQMKMQNLIDTKAQNSPVLHFDKNVDYDNEVNSVL
jgi:hypothetical protein